MFQFLRPKKNKATTECEYRYITNCMTGDSSKKYKISSDEEFFVKALIQKLINNKLQYLQLQLHRMANGAISVSYARYPVGKIKLQGRKTYMQILKDVYTFDVVDNLNTQEYIDNIDLWILYIKYICK